MTNMKPVDFTGRDILPGDLVAYPVRRGSNMQLKTARVTSWTYRADTFIMLALNDNGRRINLTHPDRIIVLEQPNG